MGSIAVVIPAYNEASTIRDIAARAHSQCSTVIVVDDGSSDGTSACLEGLDVTLIRHARNRGKAAALITGMEAALERGADATITLDADGQHRPEDIPALIDASERNPGAIVIGSRSGASDSIPSSRYIANRIADFWISWASGYRITDSQSGFRLYPDNFMQGPSLTGKLANGFVFESEVLIDSAHNGIQSTAVSIPAIYETDSRPSHFRGVPDITRISFMVAGKLLRRGLYFPGLYRAYIRPGIRQAAPPGFDGDALLALILSCLALFPTLGIFYAWLLLRVHRTAFSSATEVAATDAIIILGHKLIDGVPSPDFRHRLDRAIELSKANRSAVLILLGGRPDAGITEAEAGERYLRENGVEAKRILKENLSSNTVENLIAAGPSLGGFRKISLVSNRYHLERIMTISSGMGIELTPCAAENKYAFFSTFFKTMIEAFYLHWYWSGRIYGRLTRNTRVLNKIGQS